MQIIQQLTVYYSCPQSLSIDEAVQVPAICTPAATSEVKVISQDEWKEFLQKCKETDFSQAISHLEELCGENGTFKLQIRDHAQPLTFKFYKNEYWSTGIWKGAFEGRKRNQNAHLYYYFKLYETIDTDDCLMLVRSDLSGKYAELCNINKGANLSGRDLLTNFCMPFLEAMNFETGLLHDEALKSLFLEDQEHKLFLRMLLPITSKTGSAEEGHTFYSPYKFVPLDCHYLLHVDEQHQATQDHKAYYSALQYVRTRKIADLVATIFSYSPFTKQLIQGLTKRNLPFNSPDATLSDLGNQIFVRARSNTPESAQATRDLVSFSNILVEVRELSNKSSTDARIFNLALSTLVRHYLWVRHFKTPVLDQHYRDYIASHGKPFEDYAKQIPLTHKADWDMLGRKLYSRVPVTSFYQQSLTVETTQVDYKEFMEQMHRLEHSKTPTKSLASLSEICTKVNFSDDPLNTYWQLWVEIIEDKKRIFLELFIQAKNKRFELVVRQQTTTVLHISISGELVIVRQKDTHGNVAQILKAIENHLLPS